MKEELIGNCNGVDLYNPVPQNDLEKKELERRQEAFCDLLIEMIIRKALCKEENKSDGDD